MKDCLKSRTDATARLFLVSALQGWGAWCDRGCRTASEAWEAFQKAPFRWWSNW